MVAPFSTVWWDFFVRLTTKEERNGHLSACQFVLKYLDVLLLRHIVLMDLRMQMQDCRTVVALLHCCHTVVTLLADNLILVRPEKG
jgi:hypothetical protein